MKHFSVWQHPSIKSINEYSERRIRTNLINKIGANILAIVFLYLFSLQITVYLPSSFIDYFYWALNTLFVIGGVNIIFCVGQILISLSGSDPTYSVTPLQKKLLGLSKIQTSDQNISPAKTFKSRRNDLKLTPTTISPLNSEYYSDKSPRFKTPKQETPTRQTDFTGVLLPSPSPLYQTSTSKAIPKKSLVDDHSLKSLDTTQSMKELGITSLDRSVQNLKEWLVAKVLKPLAADIDACDSFFESVGQTSLSCSVNSVPQGSLTLQEAATKEPGNPIVQKRIRVESFLSAFENRNSIVQRIQQLANGLGSYQWDFKSESVPDCVLLFSLFCHYMDAISPAEDLLSNSSNSFTSRHVKISGQHIVGSQYFVLKEMQSSEFQFIADNVIYESPKGRTNLFTSIVFFVAYVRKEYSGYLGVLNLNGSSVQLTRVLE